MNVGDRVIVVSSKDHKYLTNKQGTIRQKIKDLYDVILDDGTTFLCTEKNIELVKSYDFSAEEFESVLKG